MTLTLSVPTGYFIYDFFDMVVNQKLSQSWELLFHHLVVGLSSTVKVELRCFILTVADRRISNLSHLYEKLSTCTYHPYELHIQ